MQAALDHLQQSVEIKEKDALRPLTHKKYS